MATSNYSKTGLNAFDRPRIVLQLASADGSKLQVDLGIDDAGNLIPNALEHSAPHQSTVVCEVSEELQ